MTPEPQKRFRGLLFATIIFFRNTSGARRLFPGTCPEPISLQSPSTQTKSRHFDRSCSRLCEQRSGEIRFPTFNHSPTSTVPHPGCPMFATASSSLTWGVSRTSTRAPPALPANRFQRQRPLLLWPSTSFEQIDFSAKGAFYTSPGRSPGFLPPTTAEG